ncbi:hypothetical protein P3342_008750 [Pyrenophora teres f. teres]|nr:hypothetical protein P3342_008750 [Pyrenophora teres f. teres]
MPAPYEHFLLFGDSITQESFSQQRGFGFSAALQNAYIRRLDIVNRGFSGYNTRQALQILPAIVPPPDQARIRFMAVFFGANDASLPDAPNKQHIPLDEFKANLRAIVSHPQIQAHDPRIILVSPLQSMSICGGQETSQMDTPALRVWRLRPRYTQMQLPNWAPN